MGIVLNSTELNIDYLNKTNSPVIICSTDKRIERLLADYEKISINQNLSKSLLEYTVDERKMHVVDEFSKLIEVTPDKIILINFEMLFNPAYKIDVLKLFIEISRKRKILVQWCGSFDGKSLIYSEPKLKDYSSFKITDYNITCVK